MIRRAAVAPPNPHFDHDRVVWDDRFSGEYGPVPYDEQFDFQWKLFLEKKKGFHHHTGVETCDAWIDGRIEDLTGVEGYLERRRWGRIGYAIRRSIRRAMGSERNRDIGMRMFLDPKFPIDFFRGKRCLDAGCGAGRWTKTMMTLGGDVKSIDVSEHGLRSTSRFNKDVERLDLFEIAGRPDLHCAFDFTICWGVIMCTHDPKRAFEAVAKTVKPGGSLYIMVYAPTYHNSPAVLQQRKHYHRELHTIEEKLKYAYQIVDDPRNTINALDMLNTFYNWVIPEDVVYNWYRKAGFADMVTMNRDEPNRCGHHVLGVKRA